MNVYVVVEGNSTEPAVYREWIPLVNPSLTEAAFLPEVDENRFLIRSGGGWPFLKRIIEAAVDDIRSSGKFDRLVVAVDSEDFTRAQRHADMTSYITALAPPCPFHVVIQHFCFEAWALGNRKFGPRAPKDAVLRSYKEIHDVLAEDPELLPPHVDEELNRAQFAEKYLRLLIRDRGRHLTYSKSKPDLVAHPSYFHQLKERLNDTAHIASFQTFIDAFS